jgi:hypothetical protein
MADGEAENAPLHAAAARSRSREQGAHVRAQGRATKSAGTADLNAVGGPELQRGASHRDVASSSRRRAIGKRQGQARQQEVAESIASGA